LKAGIADRVDARRKAIRERKVFLTGEEERENIRKKSRTKDEKIGR
jgi:hypothetical protein